MSSLSVGTVRGPVGDAVEMCIARGMSVSTIMAKLSLTYEQVRLIKLRMDAASVL